jgi:hypothetical protein
MAIQNDNQALPHIFRALIKQLDILNFGLMALHLLSALFSIIF